MIALYPMIVSKSVSENVVPGIAKAVENYILAYAKDTIVNNPYVKKQFNFKIKGKMLYAQENIDFTQEGGVDDWEKGKKQQTNQSYEKFDRDELERQKLQFAKDKEEIRKKEREEEKAERKEKEEKDAAKQAEIDAAKRASASIKMTDTKTLSIEPTTIDIEVTDRYGNRVSESFGVKVIALRVVSDEKLSRLLLHDSQLNIFDAMIISIGRRITRRVWTFIDKWKARLGFKGTPSGDPRRDIIMGRTGHNVDGFVVLSKNEDIDNIFLSNIKRINRLFKMGWGNIIIADDINRTAYFCMRQFRGVCVAIKYAMLFQNFGHLQVFNNLEDAQRQSSSLFKIRRPLSKVLGEWVAEYRQGKYLSEDK